MRTAFAAFNLLIFASIFALLPILIGVYVYRDASRRGMNAVLWTLIAILAPSLIGFIIYLLVRGNYSNLKCPRCDATVTEQYVVCPKCGAKLKPSCPNCSTPVEPDWTVCPKCAQPLPEIQEDIVVPVRPKDKTLWKILAAIIIIPVVLILAFGTFFSINSGSTSFREVSLDTYFNDQELPQSTKDYVQDWISNLPNDGNHVYALRYRYQVLEDSKEKDYYYLIYIPGCGSVSSNSFGYSSGLFGLGDELKLELNGHGTEESFYCMTISEKKHAPGIRVSLNGKRLEDIVTVVDFNPTLYTIASESDYSMLTNAAGDLYVEQLEKEMEPDLVTITVVEDGQEVASGEFDAPDFLLNTVAGIHELHYLEDMPTFISGYRLSNYSLISIHYTDTTGVSHYEDTCDYLVVDAGGTYYLLEIRVDSQIEDILEEGKITGKDDVLAYEISAEAYTALQGLFDKP